MPVQPQKSFEDFPMGEDPLTSPGNSQRASRTYSLDDDVLLDEAPSEMEDDALRYATSEDSSIAAPAAEDFELRVAKEMALAIQQNPNLTPGELKDLMAKTQARVPTPSSTPGGAATTPAKSPPVPSRSGKSPLLKSFSKGVKSSVKKAFKPAGTPERNSGNASPTVTANAATAAAFIPSISTSLRVAPKLGDFLESSNRNTFQDHSETEDTATAATAVGTGGGNIRITGIIWKRRQGLGKYSTTAAWERRRVVLKGSRLYYYRTDVDKKDDNDVSGEEMDDEGNSPSGALGVEDHPTGSREVTGGGSTPNKAKSWFEGMSVGTKASSRSKDARGYLDLIKDNASVGASFGHSGAPTPFSLSIKVLTQTRWKLCFDTHGELMQWLAALTDVIVQGSVDSYNTQILNANDPSRVSDLGFHGQLSEPPLIANCATSGKVGGHRLWGTGHYKIQSDNYPSDGLDDVSEDELEDVLSDDDATQVQSREFTGSISIANAVSNDLVLELDGGRDVWGIPAQYIWHWGVLWNVVILLARASSTTTVENFWYLITFANIALFGFMKKDTVGGTVRPNMAVSRKMARRLSSGVGIPVTSTSDLKTLNREKSTNDTSPSAVDVGAVKPKAGTTSMRIDNPNDLPVNKDGHVFAGWRWADPGMMLVRSHNYKKDKLKVPSPGELYKCVHLDIFESRNRFPEMASRVELPKVNFKDTGPKTWNAPDTFVVSIAIPTDPPKLYSNSEDGGGYTITVYFQMHQETRDILKRVTADGYDPKSEVLDDFNKSKVNAVRLLDEWCRRAPTDDAFCARFKVLPNAQNLKEVGLPSWISKYNGKPFLIKRPGQTGFLYRHPDKSCVEFDISLHPFPYLAKQGINFMKDSYFKKVLVTFGFLIEGRAEDELPECLIGLMQLCYPDPVHAIQGEDLMAGTSPKSFE